MIPRSFGFMRFSFRLVVTGSRRVFRAPTSELGPVSTEGGERNHPLSRRTVPPVILPLSSREEEHQHHRQRTGHRSAGHAPRQHDQAPQAAAIGGSIRAKPHALGALSTLLDESPDPVTPPLRAPSCPESLLRRPSCDPATLRCCPGCSGPRS